MEATSVSCREKPRIPYSSRRVYMPASGVLENGMTLLEYPSGKTYVRAADGSLRKVTVKLEPIKEGVGA